MALHKKLYALRGVQVIAEAGWWLIFPTYWLLNALLAMYLETSDEAARRVREKPCYERSLLLAVVTPLAVALLVLSLPVALLGACFWLPTQPYRSPYIYTETISSLTAGRRETPSEVPGCQPSAIEFIRHGDISDRPRRSAVSVLSANVCLLSEGLARFNNLGNTTGRAEKIARLLTTSDNQKSAEAENIAHPGNVCVRSDTPSEIDIICLQEVFDRRACAKMTALLSKRFAYILSEVDAFRFGKVVSSGLLLASKFRIVEANFLPFSSGAKEDALAAKGLLMVKLLIDEVSNERSVGYVFTCHLQAHRDQSIMRHAQLSQAETWIAQFKEQYAEPGDSVQFDLFCGDFNMDHTSDEHRHPIFCGYVDSSMCKGAGGCGLCISAMGTELVQHRMYDEEARTPGNLMRTILNDTCRPAYLESCCPDGKGRRCIDYIFLNRDQHGDASRTDVQEHAILTSMAALTDHLPVYTKIRVSCNSATAPSDGMPLDAFQIRAV